MALPNHSPETSAAADAEVMPEEVPETMPEQVTEPGPQIIRLRIKPWDLVFTMALLGALLLLLSLTSWSSKLFGFTETVCVTDDCPPVPYGVNFYIYPFMWGGIGGAITAAVLGPFVSMVRGWYMSFWPFISVAVLTITSVLCSALAGFSARF
ncbi:hypothetical protein BST27_04865 [Mycobacterium intermedium]|uniref:Uncharacterized protein n=1 Tax=Mycobacterium intermedium TaxID=28445 RepID=A0A1E3SMT0_MYCIE|nr:hypothetical protein [Mycobacterium intermedium]MCV6966989.1 hypothetical protein [Mycobacterium intermedium]ODR03460.1 hypothetical protein BHQ20_00190 [Mycobacterium intermedium]OPE50075.1 hypothetical protein BV508_11780 [Mycobacterium intermedium]ORB09740.1 hypothetical protein BST27_04865 [Mycobacterium intermedium]